MVRFNIRRTLSMTLGAVATTAGDARAWLEDEEGYAAYKAAVEGTVDEVGQRTAQRLRKLFSRE